MATDELIPMPFTEAVTVNPSVCLVKGKTYPFVEMAAVDPGARSVRESERRAFDGGGARFAPGDTLMARITPCLENGKIARFRPTDQTSIGFGSTEFIVIRGKAGVTTDDYAYYLTKWDEFRQFAIGQMTGSSGRQRVPADSLAGFNAMVPSLPVQQRITRVLGKLDDKIELNRRMNRTLEKMAAAIFKSWFIDFDPVHAKADGRLPAPQSGAARQAGDTGLPAEVADLFPHTFEDSELGPIPKGWKVGRLDDLLVLQRGFDLPVGQRKRGSVPVVMASGIGDHHNEYKVSGPGVVTGRSGKLGDVFLIPNNFWPLNTTLWVKEYRETRPCHAYLLLKELALSSYNAGSAVPTLNRNHIHNVKVILPPSDIVDAYEHFAMSFYRKCWANEEQNHRLSGLSDTLLPKLMSGEVEAPAAEATAEEGT